MIHDEISIFEVSLDNYRKISDSDSDDNSYYIGSEITGANQTSDVDSFSVNMQQISDTEIISSSMQQISDTNNFYVRMEEHQTAVIKATTYDPTYLETDICNHASPLPLDLDSTKLYPLMDSSYIQPTEMF